MELDELKDGMILTSKRNENESSVETERDEEQQDETDGSSSSSRMIFVNCRGALA